MKKNKKFLFVGFLAMLMFALLCGPAISSETVIIVGTVNDNYEIVTDNDQVYEIGDNEKGEELIELVDKRVRVTGTVEELEGSKVITIISYEIIEE